MEVLTQMEKAIERKREEMYRASKQYGLSSRIVLRTSQELDVLLNKYRNQRSRFIKQ